MSSVDPGLAATVETALKTASLDDMGRWLAVIGEEHGFDHQCCTAATRLPSLGLEQQAGLLTTLPPSFSERYDALGYIEDDAIIALWRKTASPIRWSEAEAASPRGSAARRIFGEAREERIHDGISFSLRVGHRQFLGVSFARTTKARSSLTSRAELSLWQLTNAWMERFTEQHDLSREIKLTAAQVAVLDAMLQGYSTKAIAQLLDISPSAVKQRYEAIGRKLPSPSVSRARIAQQALSIGLAAKYGLH